MNIDQANREATDRMIEARPVLVGLDKAIDVIPGMRQDCSSMPGRRSPGSEPQAPCAGPSPAPSSSRARPRRGRGGEAGDLGPDHAGALPPPPDGRADGGGDLGLHGSRHLGEQDARQRRLFEPERRLRQGAALRRLRSKVQDRLRWMHDVTGAGARAMPSPPAVASTCGLARPSHCTWAMRVTTATRPAPPFSSSSPGPAHGQAAPDPETARRQSCRPSATTPLSVLNPATAACKASADAGHGVEGSTIVTAMARNGTVFGIRSQRPGRAVVHRPRPAAPTASTSPVSASKDANADIGDSTITETAGIGGFAMASAPAIVTFVSGVAQGRRQRHHGDVRDHLHRAQDFTMPVLELPRHAYRHRHPQGRGAEPHPRINTGIAHKNAGVGQIGAGLVRPPMEIFEAALVAFAERYGY